jgi:hypothetical protein
MGLIARPESKRAIQKQIKLPFRTQCRICKESIFVRLGRSAITASGIFLGVAFLSAVLVSSAIAYGPPARKLEILGRVDPSQGARAIWLVTMSLLVATVGIVNSMLMSVTERYKEIGTMKCLGALDSFIVRLFLLESGVLGLLGSIAGAIVGSLLATLAQSLKFGWNVALAGWSESPFQIAAWKVPLVIALLGGILVGGLLSVAAALYPAWRAAKMPPAAALRSEF